MDGSSGKKLAAGEPVRDEHDVARTFTRRAIGDAQVPVHRIARLREHCGSVSRGAGRVSVSCNKPEQCGLRVVGAIHYRALFFGHAPKGHQPLLGHLSGLGCPWGLPAWREATFHHSTYRPCSLHAWKLSCWRRRPLLRPHGPDPRGTVSFASGSTLHSAFTTRAGRGRSLGFG